MVEARLGDVTLAVSDERRFSEGAVDDGVAGGGWTFDKGDAMSGCESDDSDSDVSTGRGTLYLSLGMRAGGGRLLRSAMAIAESRRLS